MRIKNFYERMYDRFFSSRSLLRVTITALLVRLLFFPWQSGDYIDFLHPWFLQLKEAGGLAGVGRPVGNYIVTYIYILALLTCLPVPDIITIKFVSCIGDVLLAWYSRKLCRAVTGDDHLSRIVYTTVLFLPTVILNSSAWAQCDALYTAALVACLFHLNENRPLRAMACFSIAFVFKLQAVFLAPVILAALLRRKVLFRHTLLVPAVYILTILPAYWAGRPFVDLLFLYIGQSGTYSDLCMNAPNFYALFPAGYANAVWEAVGIAGAFFILVASTAFMVGHRLPLEGETLLLFSLFSLSWIPFVLPHMHERYFYPADILAILVVFCFPKAPSIFLHIPACSLLLTVRFVFGALWIFPAALFAPMLAACLSVSASLYRCKAAACPPLWDHWGKAG